MFGWFVNFLVCVLLVFRDQDLAEALDSSSSDMEMEKGMVQVQEQSAQHRAKMWKVIRNRNTQKLIYLICKRVRNKLRTEVIPHVDKVEIFFCQTQWNRLERLDRHTRLRWCKGWRLCRTRPRCCSLKAHTCCVFSYIIPTAAIMLHST